MKLAEALQIRKDLAERMNNLKTRLNQNATVQDGEKPSENPNELLKELEKVSEELENIIGRINLTNAKTIVDDLSITEMIARRDVMMEKINILRSFRYSASDLTDRAYGTDIKVLSTVSVPKIQKEIDELSKKYRNLELKIQESNWLTELL